MLTCKEFLQELADYLDITVDVELRRELEAHISNCSKCFVILDTTQKTIKLYKGMQPRELPEDVHVRLMAAVERKMALPAARRCGDSIILRIRRDLI